MKYLFLIILIYNLIAVTSINKAENKASFSSYIYDNGNMNNDFYNSLLSDSVKNQNKKGLTAEEINILPKTSVFVNSRNMNYGTLDDGYPDSVYVVGTIDKYCSYETPCGVLFLSGTIRVRLEDNKTSYKDDYIYIVISCLVGGENLYIGKKFNFMVYKLYNDNIQNRFGSIFNCMETALPFYYYDNDKNGRL